ncbi:type I-E CRISPR-associated endonuclease Cas1e [Rhodospirillum rubrum]|uniref:CRISPR-associated endonuclease Cas1 n=1 Tax=Rhodospirillum rubrum (strain ATCC 11170 / ATH 1.1.1 / DSM 467 / LMG 4362 / NCIMB 8255 / S1) TaxID=269796 RepID=Q2RXJ3_RHORT|nr:type I-E CRISPR-associated endonuclease Cas1e [Rhodospirillum rubrum]ABC21152.1 CRISPR-associated protein, Cas1 family [Rhodospirillum rubrum ATCC 11170]AEO46823.1 CRISPR-associated protein Cas1 [Rhodospirillum rubrum F11]MBK5952700.1 subtype I-E CRISPR-associated endonuclease Cas1 [Rhodospirillum rubrum]QXG80843.1 type I-E CRISPR-associated endonuclease Cas1e [Rhodospirillum rubrum]HAP98570.1 type I-E CRISPR-associated endonuclease Cas1 [Rhodospirillum rubrum]
MLSGRLGLEKARIPHADRHGLVWLDRGRLEVEDGCLRFVTAGGGELAAGDYQIPHQAVSIILLGPGSSVTHDALRLLARHGCALAAIGQGAVRFYTAPPLMPDSSALARAQVTLWADPKTRMEVARAMYAMRFGEIVRTRDIEVLRGQEGARIKRSYQLAAERYGIPWRGRSYDRADPEAGDEANQAINHAATAMTAAASVAVAAVGAIPQLGFVHEDSGQSFVLDIADLYRHDITLDIAFGAVKEAEKSGDPLERLTRQRAAKLFRQRGVIPSMIDRIKTLLGLGAETEEIA